MWDIIVNNLMYTIYGELLFVGSYLSNISFSLYYNIRVLEQTFDRTKLINSLYKVGAFVVGTLLLCVVITVLPIFVENLGLTLPQEYVEVFSDLVIISVFITASCRYSVEAFNKMKAILNTSKLNPGE